MGMKKQCGELSQSEMGSGVLWRELKLDAYRIIAWVRPEECHASHLDRLNDPVVTPIIGYRVVRLNRWHLRSGIQSMQRKQTAGIYDTPARPRRIEQSHKFDQMKDDIGDEASWTADRRNTSEDPLSAG
jgi:hypothetical protein